MPSPRAGQTSSATRYATLTPSAGGLSTWASTNVRGLHVRSSSGCSTGSDSDSFPAIPHIPVRQA
jgi:hypothetical protein